MVQWDINYLNSLLYKLWAEFNAKKHLWLCLTWHKLLEAIQLLALKIYNEENIQVYQSVNSLFV